MMTTEIKTTEVSAFPYPGLRAFTEQESHLFYGRKKQVFQLLSLLEENRFLAVIGPSGSGKSSLVRAGLLPQLRESGLFTQRGRDWLFLKMKPGLSPLVSLAREIHSHAPIGLLHEGDARLTEAVLRSGPKGLQRVFNDSNLSRDTNVLLLVDQFEELFQDDQSRKAEEGLEHQRSEQETGWGHRFVQLLLNIVTQQDWSVHVVITMRTDFIGDCNKFVGLPEAVSQSQFLVPRLDVHSLEKAIRSPLVQPEFSCELDQEVVDVMVNAAHVEQDALPLIQHALLRMWHHAKKCQKGMCLPRTTTGRAKSLAEILDSHGREIYDSIPPSQKRIAEKLFRILTARGPQGQLIRNPTTLKTVAAAVGEPEKLIGEVVAKFTAPGVHFLNVSSDGGKERLINVTHESLLRHWRMVSQWLKEEDESVEMLRLLSGHAKRWKSGKGGFWVGSLLDEAQRWRDRESPNDSWAARYDLDWEICNEFLDSSLKSAQEQIKAGASEVNNGDAGHDLVRWLESRLLATNDFFISFGWHDGLYYVRSLRRALELRGYRCYVCDDLESGDDWENRMKGVLNRSREMIIIASPAALQSEWVAKETEHFRKELKRPITLVSFGEPSEGAAILKELHPKRSIAAELEDLKVGPTDRVISEIVQGRMTNHRVRRRRLLSYFSLLMAFLVVVSFGLTLLVDAKAEALKVQAVDLTAANKQLETTNEEIVRVIADIQGVIGGSEDAATPERLPSQVQAFVERSNQRQDKLSEEVRRLNDKVDQLSARNSTLQSELNTLRQQRPSPDTIREWRDEALRALIRGELEAAAGGLNTVAQWVERGDEGRYRSFASFLKQAEAASRSLGSVLAEVLADNKHAELIDEPVKGKARRIAWRPRGWIRIGITGQDNNFNPEGLKLNAGAIPRFVVTQTTTAVRVQDKPAGKTLTTLSADSPVRLGQFKKIGQEVWSQACSPFSGSIDIYYVTPENHRDVKEALERALCTVRNSTKVEYRVSKANIRYYNMLDRSAAQSVAKVLGPLFGEAHMGHVPANLWEQYKIAILDKTSSGRPTKHPLIEVYLP